MNNYRPLPSPASSPRERLDALKDVKPIIAPGGFGAMMGNSASVDNLLRLAEYVTIGHDYKDTHPESTESAVHMPPIPLLSAYDIERIKSGNESAGDVSRETDNDD